VPNHIHPATPMPDADVVERFGKLASSLVSDVFDRWSGTNILPVAGMAPGEVVVGPAFTCRTRPGDNLAVHKALDLARAGEILVVEAGGALDRAILGGLMGSYAKHQGVAALVVDGAVRDKSDLERLAPPVFARGLSQLGPYKDGPGELRCPVSIGGLVVADGDLIVADEDGITCVPRALLDEILELAEAKKADEEAQFDAIERGEWDRSWIDRVFQPVEVA
jgi:regulator of RNase E activity RraA